MALPNDVDRMLKGQSGESVTFRKADGSQPVTVRVRWQVADLEQDTSSGSAQRGRYPRATVRSDLVTAYSEGDEVVRLATNTTHKILDGHLDDGRKRVFRLSR